MTWAKLSDNFHSHPKIVGLPLPAIGLYALGLSYAADFLTDGFLPEAWVRNVVKNQPYRSLSDRLVEANLWLRVVTPRGYQIVDFLDYNASAAQIREKREAARERVTRYRQRTNALVTRPIGPEPEPEPVVKDLDGLALNVSNVLGDFDISREVSDYARELRDGNDSTEAVLTDFRRKLPEAAFRTAMEALRERRERKPALVSETRYFVRLLKNMVLDGRYDA